MMNHLLKVFRNEMNKVLKIYLEITAPLLLNLN